MEVAPGPTADDRLWGAIGHWSAFAMYLTGIGFIGGPLVIWLWKKDASAFAAEEAREALNFNISIAIYYAGAAALCLTLVLIPVAIGLFALLHAFQVICIVIGGLKAYDGRSFKYPLNLRLVK